jgi:hypothetical protein
MAQQQMSLFGPSVYDIQRQQMQQDQANAIQQAQLSPYQGIAAAAAMAGTRAGRSLAGLFGIEDPALSEAKKMEELKAAVASQWDGNDPLEAYKIFAKEASARGLTQAAIGAATQVKAFEADRSKTELGKIKTEAEIAESKQRVTASQGQETRASAEEAKAKRASLATTELNQQKAREEIKSIQLKIREQEAELRAMPDDVRKAMAIAKLNQLKAQVNESAARVGLIGAQAAQVSQDTSMGKVSIIPPNIPGEAPTVVRVTPTGASMLPVSGGAGVLPYPGSQTPTLDQLLADELAKRQGRGK